MVSSFDAPVPRGSSKVEQVAWVVATAVATSHARHIPEGPAPRAAQPASEAMKKAPKVGFIRTRYAGGEVPSLSRDKKRIVEAHAAILERWLERHATVPETEWRKLLAGLEVHTIDAGACLTRAGEVADRFGLIADGVVRFSIDTEDGRSYVRRFGGSGDLVGAYVSLLTGAPSLVSIEALVPTTMIALRWKHWCTLLEGHACWIELDRRLTRQLLIEREMRAMALLTQTPEQRYAEFRATHGHLLAQLRQVDIASYIGITPVSLSRMRARFRRRRSGH
jgi:CRP-like cAMP-binding protein